MVKKSHLDIPGIGTLRINRCSCKISLLTGTVRLGAGARKGKILHAMFLQFPRTFPRS